MPEKPKTGQEETQSPSEPSPTGNWSDDQKRRAYYYDDACGYEEYDPDSDEEREGDDSVTDP